MNEPIDLDVLREAQKVRDDARKLRETAEEADRIENFNRQMTRAFKGIVPAATRVALFNARSE